MASTTRWALAAIRATGASLAVLAATVWGLPRVAAGHGLAVGPNWHAGPVGWPRSLDTFEAALLVVFACALVPSLASTRRAVEQALAAAMGVVSIAIVVTIGPGWLWHRVADMPAPCAAVLADAGAVGPAERPWATALLAVLVTCGFAVVRAAPATIARPRRVLLALASAVLAILAALALWGYVDDAIVEPLLWHC